LEEDTYEVAVKEPPEKGKANQRIIALKLKIFKISGEED